MFWEFLEFLTNSDGCIGGKLSAAGGIKEQLDVMGDERCGILSLCVRVQALMVCVCLSAGASG